ncbi:MAG: hotdog domain-containing protein [Vampirovibrionales bacterium]|nr:hotdog domain-containing protein [Vampirovibrionales bacterium]
MAATPSHQTPYHTRCLVRTPVYPWQVNEAGFIKAGHVLKLIDILGSEAAFKYLRSENARVVTASVDRTDFRASIRAWEMVTMVSHITQVWHSSLEAQVIIRAENFITGESRDVAVSHLVFVSIDPDTRKTVALSPYVPKTSRQKQLAQSADLRKQNRLEEGKSVPFIPIEDEQDQPVFVQRQMGPLDANGMGNVFGGIILDIIDEAASKAAERQSLSRPVVGVRLDRMSFIAPGYIGETIEAKAIITKTWQTSMEVQVEVSAINPNSGDRRQIASSYLVYVGIGNDGKSAPVPPLNPKTPLQKQRAEAADKRRAIRKEEEKQAALVNVPEIEDIEALYNGVWQKVSKVGGWLKHKFPGQSD